MPPLDQRLADRCTIGAVEKEIFLREIARSECIDAAPIGAVAIDAVALRVVVEQYLAAGRFCAIRALPADDGTGSPRRVLTRLHRTRSRSSRATIKQWTEIQPLATAHPPRSSTG